MSIRPWFVAAVVALGACADGTGNTADAQKMPERIEIGELAEPPAGLESDEDQSASGERALLTAIPAAFHGRWAAQPADCAPGGETGLTVGRDGLRFYESAGEVAGITIRSPRELALTTRYQGEGERRDRTHTLALSPEGDRLTVTSEGVALVRARCR